MKKSIVKALLLSGVVSLSVSTFADDTLTETEERIIDLTNDNGSGLNNETLKVPVTATVNRQVLNVQFTGNVPMVTVSVNNAFTGVTVSQKSMTALSGSFCTVPVGNLPQGAYTVSVTNEQNGESVSGQFDVNENGE